MIYAATGNAGPAFGDQPSRASHMYTTVRCVVNNTNAPVLVVSFIRSARKILVLVRGVGLGLVFDELALIAQPLALSPLGVARIIFGGSPAKSQGARRRVCGDAQFSCAGRCCDPAAPASAMAVANGGTYSPHRAGGDRGATLYAPCLNYLLNSARRILPGLRRAAAHRQGRTGFRTARSGAGDPATSPGNRSPGPPYGIAARAG